MEHNLQHQHSDSGDLAVITEKVPDVVPGAHLALRAGEIKRKFMDKKGTYWRDEYLFMTHEYVLISSSQDRRVLDHIVLRCVMYATMMSQTQSLTQGA
jgi:hypothetical protein